MYIYRVMHKGAARWAMQREDGEALELLSQRSFEELVEGYEQGLESEESLGSVEDAVLLAPSVPTKILCIGLNYRHHAEEMNKQVPDEPLMFMKPVSALLGPDRAVELPPQSSLVHHEGELAMVVGRRAKRVSEEDFHDVIFGYACANDVTARDIQRREGKYTRGKGFDTFCPFGPRLRPARELEIERESVTCRVNGEERQTSGVDDLIFKLPQVVKFVSEVMTLMPGDIILTGTPSGVGELLDGDEVEVEVTGVGVLRHTVSGVLK